MRHRFLLFSACLVFLLHPGAWGKVHENRLSDSARISLITGSPGMILYTRFGHSAIRVYDPVQDINTVFNYGTFSFNSQFYINFISGKLWYYLSAYDFRRMEDEYNYLNQSLFEQVLNLTQDEKEEIYAFLLVNYKPENRSYLYEPYLDNCSSRIRDVFENILKEKLEFRYDYITDQKSFRQLTNDQLGKDPWGKFGLNLLMGLPIDRIISPRERMFLPYEMMYAFEHAIIKTDSSEELFAAPVKAVCRQQPFEESVTFFTPGIVFWSLFFAVFLFTIFQYYKRSARLIIDGIIFSILGFLGCILLIMWFGTDHLVTKMNFNILWAFPTDIILVYLLFRKPHSQWCRYLLALKIAINILPLAGWNFLPQSLHAAMIPFMLINILRGGYLLWILMEISPVSETKT